MPSSQRSSRSASGFFLNQDAARVARDGERQLIETKIVNFADGPAYLTVLAADDEAAEALLTPGGAAASDAIRFFSFEEMNDLPGNFTDLLPQSPQNDAMTAIHTVDD